MNALGMLLDTLPVPWWTLAACAIVMFGASIVFGITGFGASLITIPLLSQLLPLPLLLSLAVVTDLALASVVALSRRSPQGSGSVRLRADWAEVGRLVLPALAGAALGVTLLVGLPRDAAMLALGVFLLGYGLWAFRSRVPDAPLSPRWAVPFGFSGGLLGALFGIGGPPYVIYLTRRILDKDVLRASIGAMVLLSLMIRVLAFAAAGLLLQPGLPAMLCVLLPACVAGVLFGARLFSRLSRERLLRAIAILLAGSGATLIVRAALQLAS